VVVIGASVVAGSLCARLVAPSVENRYFPWITGRSLGVAAYLALVALVMIGTWMRHPWRLRMPILHAESRLRAHAALAIATVMLVVGHIVALASDKYAGVGWLGAIVPGLSHYRRLAVAVGVVAFLLIVLLTVSAGLAGRRGTSHWLALHRGAAITFAAVWFHGVMAGTDAWRLRLVYFVTGAIVVVLVATRASVSARDLSLERFRQSRLDAESPPMLQSEGGLGTSWAAERSPSTGRR
jgi:predicted ferric reductase